MSESGSILFLCWGNPGRQDDGLGPRFAEQLEARGPAAVEVVSDYQLQVEHAADAAGAGKVVFVDAARKGAEPFSLSRLVPTSAGIGFTSHSLNPGAVLALARDLFGCQPDAWLLAIRGYRFDELEERLSDEARANLDAAVGFVTAGLARAEDEPWLDSPPPPRGKTTTFNAGRGSQ